VEEKKRDKLHQDRIRDAELETMLRMQEIQEQINGVISELPQEQRTKFVSTIDNRNESFHNDT
jgi:hypothetical protein